MTRTPTALPLGWGTDPATLDQLEQRDEARAAAAAAEDAVARAERRRAAALATADRIANGVLIRTDGHWRWGGPHTPAGTPGYVVVLGQRVRAVVAIWELARRQPLQPRHHLERVCSETGCVRPSHHREVPAHMSRAWPRPAVDFASDLWSVLIDEDDAEVSRWLGDADLGNPLGDSAPQVADRRRFRERPKRSLRATPIPPSC